MGRTKKQTGVHEPVKLREKAVKNGVKSLYLDGYVKGKRWYKFLSKDIGYILPPIDLHAKMHNAEVWRQAQARCAQINSDILSGKDGAPQTTKNGKMLLQDWMDIYAQRQLENGHKDSRQIAYTKKILLEYAGANVQMQDIDKNFCLGYLKFIKHLQPNWKHKAVQELSGKSVRKGGTPYPQKEGEIEQVQLQQIEQLEQRSNELSKEERRVGRRLEYRTSTYWKTGKRAPTNAYIDRRLQEMEDLGTESVNAYLQAKEIKQAIERQRTEDANTATIKPATQANYYRCFSGALNAAVRADIIPYNPFDKIASVDKIRVPESAREYLTIDEIKRLIATECKRENVKNAFLFSCFCGLRISDIYAITWGQITMDGEQMRLQLRMQKTKDPLYLPISEQAQKYMPQRGTAGANDKIFNLPTGQSCNNIIAEWAKAAGIEKKVTYHVSRHTFGTMMHTLGAETATIQKLMGHADIETTLIYAKIVNAKKDEAVNLVNGIF